MIVTLLSAPNTHLSSSYLSRVCIRKYFVSMDDVLRRTRSPEQASYSTYVCVTRIPWPATATTEGVAFVQGDSPRINLRCGPLVETAELARPIVSHDDGRGSESIKADPLPKEEGAVAQENGTTDSHPPRWNIASTTISGRQLDLAHLRTPLTRL